MKKSSGFRNNSLLVICLILIFGYSCKKDDNNSLTYETPIDQDGNTYKTIKIGTQTWMAENLRTTKYRNGDPVGTTIPATKDIQNEETPKYQWPNHGDESAVVTYGRLYTWYAVHDIRNIAPKGWHVPSSSEWITLITYLGGDSVAGVKMKETGENHWNTPNVGATNESGFTAIPTSIRSIEGPFLNVAPHCYWWCSDQYYTSSGAWVWYLINDDDIVHNGWTPFSAGYSVRCVKD